MKRLIFTLFIFSIYPILSQVNAQDLFIDSKSQENFEFIYQPDSLIESEEITINGLNQEKFVFQKEKINIHESGVESWRGKDKNGNILLMLESEKNILKGKIYGEKGFNVSTLGENFYQFDETPVLDFQDKHFDRNASEHGRTDTTGHVIDIHVFYSPFAYNPTLNISNPHLAEPDIQASIDFMIEELNMSLELSLIDLYVNLTGTTRTTEYNPTTIDLERDLDFFDNPSDGILDYVELILELNHADIGAFVSSYGPDTRNHVCGAASTSNKFVLSHFCGIGGTTFSHEFGHILGANHNEEDNLYPLSEYAFGFKGPNFKTIMSYRCAEGSTRCTTIPYFSTPNVTYRRISIGDSTHNNARRISENALRISRNRYLISDFLSTNIDRYNFGQIGHLNYSQSIKITINNRSLETARISQLMFVNSLGERNRDFQTLDPYREELGYTDEQIHSLEPIEYCGTTILPLHSCDLIVAFRPLEFGNLETDLSINIRYDFVSITKKFRFSGEGMSYNDLTTDINMINFGMQSIGTTSHIERIELTNTADNNVNLNINNISIMDVINPGNSAQFRILRPEEIGDLTEPYCYSSPEPIEYQGSLLRSGESCMIYIIFEPTRNASSIQNELIITSNHGNTRTILNGESQIDLIDDEIGPIIIIPEIPYIPLP